MDPPWDLNPHLLNRSELYLFELGGSVESVRFVGTVVIGRTGLAWCTWHKTHFQKTSSRLGMANWERDPPPQGLVCECQIYWQFTHFSFEVFQFF